MIPPAKSEPARPQTPSAQGQWDTLRLVVIPLLCVLAPLLYLALAKYNLPVAANVDERTALTVFSRFHAGSANPGFFLYPSLYFYVTYLLAAPFGYAHIIFTGRLINLAFVGLTAGLSYRLCRHLRSDLAGLACALFVITSPTIVESGSYLCTDALLAAMTVAALDAMLVYSERKDRRSWLISQVLIGLAVGCKYTAFLLWLTYLVCEMYAAYRSNEDGTQGQRLSRRLLGGALLAIALFSLAVAVFFPVQAAVHFAVAHHTSADVKSLDSYIRFFTHCRLVAAAAGVFFASVAAAVFALRPVYRVLSPGRIYLGLLITLAVTLLTTPYAVLAPGKFLYDIGALMRGNIVVEKGGMQWGAYLHWMLSSESAVLLFAGAAGFYLVLRQKARSFNAMLIFAVLYTLAIGSSHLGFQRYLTPLLPVVYIFAAALVVLAFRTTTDRRKRLQAVSITLFLMVALAGAQNVIRLRALAASRSQPDAAAEAYRIALEAKPAQVEYSGLAPFQELKDAGIPVTQVSEESLESGVTAAQLPCNTLLLFDAKNATPALPALLADPTLKVLRDDRRGDGQLVLKKKDCPITTP